MIERMIKMIVNTILPYFPVSATGGTKIVYEYMNYLAKKGHDICIYYCKDYCVPFHRIPQTIERIWRHIIQEKSEIKWFNLDKRIKRKAIDSISESTIDKGDIIIATGVNTAKQISLLSNEKGAKIYLIQGFENWNISDEEVYETYRLPFTKIVVSNWLKKIVDDHSDIPPILLSNGIDKKIFYVQNNHAARKTHTLCFHYREEPLKGCKYAIAAIERLEKIYNDLKVYVVCKSNPTKELPSSCELLNNLTPKQVAAVNNRSQVFLCTSIDEGFGLPGLEAMACGCALVSTNYAGVLEYAINGYNSVLIPTEDVDAIVKAICYVFDNTSFREEIVSHAVTDSCQRDIEKTCSKFEKILLNRLEEKTSGTYRYNNPILS